MSDAPNAMHLRWEGRGAGEVRLLHTPGPNSTIWWLQLDDQYRTAEELQAYLWRCIEEIQYWNRLDKPKTKEPR